MVNNFNNVLVRNRLADVETWYTASGTTTKFAQMMTLGKSLTFYGKVKFGPLCFCYERSSRVWKWILGLCGLESFRCACPATQKGQGCGSLSEASSNSLYCVSKQRRLWRNCTDGQGRLSLHCLAMITLFSCGSSYGSIQF